MIMYKAQALGIPLDFARRFFDFNAIANWEFSKSWLSMELAMLVFKFAPRR